VLGRAGTLPCGTHRAARIRRFIRAAGRDRPGAVRRGDEPPTARDPTGSSSCGRTALKRCCSAGVAKGPRQANGAPAGAPSLARQARVTRRTFSVPGGPPRRAPEPGANALWPTALARLPRLVARGCPVAVPGPV